jgi:hypothetical protein
MAEEQITYESLQEDQNFLNSAFHSLRGLGQNVSEDPKDIIDSFLTMRRYFDVNLGSTLIQGKKIEEWPDEYKQLYSHALSKIEKMPSFFKEGGAPAMDAVLDFGGAGLSDPTNLASGVAALFTAGLGGIGIQAAKEATKRGVMAAIQARLKASIGKNMLKAYLAEGSVAALGGGSQQKLAQDVDMSLGRRKEGDYDYLHILGQGAAEGILSPLAGVTTNLIGGSVIDATKPLIKKATDLQAVSNVTNWLKNNLAPLSAFDEVSVRLTERATGETRPVEEIVEKISLRIDNTMKKDFPEIEGSNLVNAAMEGEAKALAEVKKRSPEMAAHLDEWFGYVRQVQDLAGSAKYASKKVKNIYKYDSNKPGGYARDIYEKFSKTSRATIDEFLERPENKNIKDDLFKLIKENPKVWGRKSKLFTEKGKPLYKTNEQRDKRLGTFLEELYDPKATGKARLGPLKSREDIPDVIKQIYGYNFNPGIRALETVRGIVESSARIRLASSLADSLMKRGQAVKAEVMDDPNMVPLVTYLDPQKNTAINPDAPFVFRKDLYDPALSKIYVPKDEASTLKLLSEGFDGRILDDVLGGKGKELLNLFAGIQGYIKKSKTVYSLQAQARNALSAVQYVMATGNGRGIIDGIRLLAPANKERRKELVDVVSRLGLKGSQVDIGQIMTRIGDLDKIKDKSLLQRAALNIMTLGVPALESTKIPLKMFGAKKDIEIGKPIAKYAQKAYVATDDIGKIASFLRERKRSQDIWNARPDTEKDLLRKQFSDEFGIDQAVKDFDTKLLDEDAVKKVMNIVPVYSRIPKILEKMRGIPILGSFTAFPAENLRNKYNLFKLAGNEIQEGILSGNKELVKAGRDRLLMQVTVASAPSVAAYTYNIMNDTDHVVDAIRESGPPWSKYHALAVRRDKKNPDKYFVSDLSYNNPDQFALDMIMPFMIDAANGRDIVESLDENFLKMLKQQASVFLEPSMATQQGEKTLDMIKALQKGDGDAFARAASEYYKLAEPGFAKTAREMGTDLGMLKDFPEVERNLSRLYFGEDRKHFEDSGSTADWFAKHGLNKAYGPLLMPWSMASREREFNPKKNFAFTSRTLLRNSSNDFRQGATSIENELTDPTLSIDYEDIGKRYDSMLAEEYAAYQQMAGLVSSYKRFMKPTELNRLILKDKDARGSLSKRGARFLLANKYSVSPSKRLSTKKELFKKIRDKNPDISLPDLKKYFLTIEKKYDGLSLSEDAPEPLEFKEE